MSTYREHSLGYEHDTARIEKLEAALDMATAGALRWEARCHSIERDTIERCMHEVGGYLTPEEFSELRNTLVKPDS